MKKFAILSAVLLATTAFAQEAPPPESCIVTDGASSPVTVEHAGREYRLASALCREEFLTDPERYAQLYDALLELAAAGKRIAPATPSLVPS